MAHHGESIPVEDPGTVDQHAGELETVSLYVGGIGLVFAILIAVLSDSWDRFQYSYLHNFCFAISISLGALFFVLIQHLTRAHWSAVVRRLAEIMAVGFVPLGILFIPILVLLIGDSDVLFSWNNEEYASTDPLIQGKQIYLNSRWFVLRSIVYFAFWIFCARSYLRLSTEQDKTGDPELSLRMERWSAGCLILFALSITFAAVDWIMSLDPHWFSTIIGVYFFANANVAFYAALAVVVYVANANGILNQSITAEHRHDIGKLLFGFNCFWAYIAFPSTCSTGTRISRKRRFGTCEDRKTAGKPSP